MERAIFRGEIYYADLEGQVVGSEQTGARPVVILQNNVGNEFSPTIIVALITSKTYSKTRIPTHIYIKASPNGVYQDSIVLLEQIKTIDKSRLKRRIGRLQVEEMMELEKALIISLGINREILSKQID